MLSGADRKTDAVQGGAITVDLSARTGQLRVNVQPAHATVYVDGRARGQGSTTLRLSSTPHRVEVRKSGYQTWSRTITPRPGYPQTVNASLRSDAEIARAKLEINVKTSQGKTLRRIEPGTFMMGSSRADPGRRARIEEVALLLRSVLEARRRVVLDVNVAAADLERLLEVLPATVQRLREMSPLYNCGRTAEGCETCETVRRI